MGLTDYLYISLHHLDNEHALSCRSACFFVYVIMLLSNPVIPVNGTEPREVLLSKVWLDKDGKNVLQRYLGDWIISRNVTNIVTYSWQRLAKFNFRRFKLRVTRAAVRGAVIPFKNVFAEIGHEATK